MVSAGYLKQTSIADRLLQRGQGSVVVGLEDKSAFEAAMSSRIGFEHSLAPWAKIQHAGSQTILVGVLLDSTLPYQPLGKSM